eukprot:scaffold175155_cov35-Prasinocladus_malaysianus.AAC.1
MRCAHTSIPAQRLTVASKSRGDDFVSDDALPNDSTNQHDVDATNRLHSQLASPKWNPLALIAEHLLDLHRIAYIFYCSRSQIIKTCRAYHSELHPARYSFNVVVEKQCEFVTDGRQCID